MSTFPQIGYEIFVMGKNLFFNPAHVPSFEATPENLPYFMLPSTRTGGGGGVYQFFEDSLVQRFPDPDGLLVFAGEKLDESVPLLKSLTPEAFERTRADVLAKYGTIVLPNGAVGLPRQTYHREPIPETEFGNIAEQYARHMIGERLSQPPRKVSAIDDMLVLSRDELRRGRLHEAIMRRMDGYRQLGTNASLHELSQRKAIEIVTGFEGMMRGDPNFLL